jgi:serine/threonine protein kinase
MPPEQATTGIVDRRSDLYSLGIVLYEMLTLRRLFTGKSEFEVLLKVRDPKIVPPSQFVPDIPQELDEVVLAALARDPAARPEDAKAFRRMLAEALPRAMALDSAHLAELLSSVVGEDRFRSRRSPGLARPAPSSSASSWISRSTMTEPRARALRSTSSAGAAAALRR